MTPTEQKALATAAAAATVHVLEHVLAAVEAGDIESLREELAEANAVVRFGAITPYAKAQVRKNERAARMRRNRQAHARVTEVSP